MWFRVVVFCSELLDCLDLFLDVWDVWVCLVFLGFLDSLDLLDLLEVLEYLDLLDVWVLFGSCLDVLNVGILICFSMF